MTRIDIGRRDLANAGIASDRSKGPEPRANGARLKRLKADITINLKQVRGGDLRTISARGRPVKSEGLHGLAGIKLSGSRGAKALLDQLLDCKKGGKTVGDLVKDLTNAELVQVYKNVKRNASVFSAIAQTHGNPSALYDYATKIAGELTDKMRARDIRADDIAPKPFDLDDEQNEEAVRTLGRALLLPLAGEGVDPQLVLNQLVQHQAGDDLWMQSLPYLSDGEIRQICDNIRSNSALLSAIAQTHGNPSALHGFASGFVGVLMAEAEKRHLPSTFEPKPFALDDPANQQLIGRLRALDAGPALSAAQDLPIAGRVPEADKLFDFMAHHFATCSSDDYWSQRDVQSQYEFFGLSVNIAHLKMLAARIDGGGEITDADIHMLASLLKDSDGKPNTELAGEIASIDTKAGPPQTVLHRMAAIVRDYYFAERPLFDFGTGESYTGRLVNLNRGAGRDLANLAAADKADALIGALDVAFRHAVADTDFSKDLVVKSFAAIAARGAPAPPEAPLIFHP
jgi:hypothetical protein